jgi:hypothetical protein
MTPVVCWGLPEQRQDSKKPGKPDQNLSLMEDCGIVHSERSCSVGVYIQTNDSTKRSLNPLFSTFYSVINVRKTG